MSKRNFEIEIMRAGVWNGQPFELSDLSAIASSFNDLKLSGRVPVGLGHQRKDTEEAQAWITALRIDGDVLLADVELVNDELIEDIKAGKWRNVSVELMRDVQRGSKQYSWVLCGLAILGAAPPAVVGLKPLNEAIASMLRVRASSALSFSYRRADDDGARLRAENARLLAQLIDEKFNLAIRNGRVMPRDREAFNKRFGDTATVEDAERWIASSPTPLSSGARTRPGSEEPRFDRPDQELSARVVKLQKECKSEGEPIDFLEATRRVMKADPALAKHYARMPSDLWG